MAEQKKKQPPPNKALQIRALELGIDALEFEIDVRESEAWDYSGAVTTPIEAAEVLDMISDTMDHGLYALRDRANWVKYDAQNYRDALKEFKAKLAELKGEKPAQATKPEKQAEIVRLQVVKD